MLQREEEVEGGWEWEWEEEWEAGVEVVEELLAKEDNNWCHQVWTDNARGYRVQPN